MLAPKTAQDASKTSPRRFQDDPSPASKTPQSCLQDGGGVPHGTVPPPRASVLGSFFIDFWFALDLHFIGILTGSFQEFSKSNPEMKASSWKTVAATRALFFARAPSILEISE